MPTSNNSILDSIWLAPYRTFYTSVLQPIWPLTDKTLFRSLIADYMWQSVYSTVEISCMDSVINAAHDYIK